MSCSPVRRAIDYVQKTTLRPELRKAGFGGTGRTMHRQDEESIALVNVQAGRPSTSLYGAFTLNLGVYVPRLEALLREHGFERPCVEDRLPDECQSTVRVRIGFLMPERRDHWWRADRGIPPDQLAREVGAAWRDHGAPWIEQCSSLAGLSRYIEQSSQPGRVEWVVWFLATGTPLTPDTLRERLVERGTDPAAVDRQVASFFPAQSIVSPRTPPPDRSTGGS